MPHHLELVLMAIPWSTRLSVLRRDPVWVRSRVILPLMVPILRPRRGKVYVLYVVYTLLVSGPYGVVT